MKNVHWTIRYRNGWLNNHCHSTRKAAIAAYLEMYAHGFFADKDWAWHKRSYGVSVVRVRLSEVDRDGNEIPEVSGR